MENFLVLENKQLQLPSGVFAGVERYSCYPGGQLEGLRLSERNMLVTHAGELVPAYSETPRRKVKNSVEFYAGGTVRSVALEEQQEIQTPIGEFPAELVTFYEGGELKRFFPLDGKLSGFWSEEDERALAIPFTFDLPFTRFTALINGVGLYEDGSIRSLTLFSREAILVHTRYGTIATRIGFSLHPDGQLASLEPAEPVALKTPIGRLFAFDSNAIGVNADANSLTFDKSGAVTGLITEQNRVAVQTPDGQLRMFRPVERISPIDDEATILVGLAIAFGADRVTITQSGQEPQAFSLSDCGFTITEESNRAFSCSPSDCASCSLCG
jgi:hypothetical protein